MARIRPARNTKSSLLAYSAGLDSALILYELLTKTDDIVHCFWCDMRTIQYDDPRAERNYYLNTALCESICVDRSIEWFNKNVRPVTLEKIVITEIEPGEWTTPTVIRMAGKLCTERKYDRFILGRSAENNSPRQGQINSPIYKKIIWPSVAPKNCPMQWPLMDNYRGRAHSLAILPDDLEKLLISCHNPHLENGEPTICMVCDKCYATLEARNMVKVNHINPDEVLDIHLRKKGAGIHSNSETKDRRYQSGNAGEPLPFLNPAWRKGK